MSKKILLDRTLKGTTEKEMQNLIINLKGALRDLPEGRRVRVLCLDIDLPVSAKQHRYWRMLCKLVEKETGNDANEFHKFIKDKFAKRLEVINNSTFEFVPSMADMSMGEAADMITKGIDFIETELGIECPKPDDLPPNFIVGMGMDPADFY